MKPYHFRNKDGVDVHIRQAGLVALEIIIKHHAEVSSTTKIQCFINPYMVTNKSGMEGLLIEMIGSHTALPFLEKRKLKKWIKGIPYTFDGAREAGITTLINRR